LERASSFSVFPPDKRSESDPCLDTSHKYQKKITMTNQEESLAKKEASLGLIE